MERPRYGGFASASINNEHWLGYSGLALLVWRWWGWEDAVLGLVDWRSDGLAGDCAGISYEAEGRATQWSRGSAAEGGLGKGIMVCESLGA